MGRAITSINHRPIRHPAFHAAHSLRHTLRDHLRAVECPMYMIDQIGGWRSVGGVGVKYGEGYASEVIGECIKKVIVSFMALCNPSKNLN